MGTKWSARSRSVNFWWCAAIVVCLVLVVVRGLSHTLAAWTHLSSVDSVAAWVPAERHSPIAGETSLKLVTWNVWGIPLVTPQREERIAAIAQMVADTGADIVCFQEVFLEADRRTLCETLAKAGLTYWRYFSSLPLGSGLLTLSRYPIEDAMFFRFSDGGDPLALQYGDWWAGKGAGVVTLDIPDFGKLHVINTHLHAGYSGHSYAEVRASQLGELMGLLGWAANGQTPVLLLGDLNHKRSEAHWNLTQQAFNLVPLAGEWSPLDYILIRDSKSLKLVTSQGQPLKGTLADGKTSLSDHTGILTEVTIRSAD